MLRLFFLSSSLFEEALKAIKFLIKYLHTTTDLVAARWDGSPVGVGSKAEHVTCRDGMKMNPDWTNSVLEATCSQHLEWELNPDVDYSCVPGT